MFILYKQGLIGQKRFSGIKGIQGYCVQSGCIQYDPVDVCGRNADLTLRSRIADYRKPMLTDALYTSRVLFDYWDKNMSVLPISDWPFTARTREEYKQTELRGHSETTSRVEHIKRFIQQNGPCFSADLKMPDKVDWYWSRTTAARAILETLYYKGELMIHHKHGTQKCYDLTENLLPADLINAVDPFPDEEAYQAERLRRRIGAVGLLWNKASDALLGIDRLKAVNRDRSFQTLQKQNAIIPVTVEGISDVMFMLKEDEKYMEKLPLEPRTEFIAPLDPMIWDRKLIRALFGFDYKWEIYTPPGIRKYGHYVLPVLQGSLFTARIEMLCQYAKKTLQVKNLWPEEGLRVDPASLTRSIESFAKFSGAEKIDFDNAVSAYRS